MMSIKTEDVEKLMKRCQIGVGGRGALETAHEIMAECYGTLGALAKERDRMQATLQGIAKADWRTWGELAQPDEFVRWARSRAAHSLRGGQ